MTGADFTVNLSAVSGMDTTVNFSSVDGTAIGPDYTANSGNLTLPAGGISATITVLVIGDTYPESNEIFYMDLSSSVHAGITDNRGKATILDDDSKPSLSIGDISVAEGNTGSNSANFVVSLSSISSANVSVNFKTSNNSAVAGVDFSYTAGTLMIPARNSTGTISIPVTGDLLFELNESFNVILSAVNGATILDAQGKGTIVNNDPKSTLSINDVTVVEGNSGTSLAVFTVSQSTVSGAKTQVNFGTQNGSALSGTDYTSANGTLIIPAGDLNGSVAVAVGGDTSVEANEDFSVKLNSPVYVTIVDSLGVATISNND